MTGLDHERVVVATGKRSGLPVIVAVHSTVLGQAVGGCRMWQYSDWQHALDDALRLSSAMTLKCALAGLPLGGGKSVIALPVGVTLQGEARRDALHDLGDVIESFGGSYGVGEDVGTTAEDMLVIGERTKHVYGLPVASGGMGEPSEPTAVGVYEAIKVTCEHLYGAPDVAGHTLTIIGLGQVGSRLAERLVADGATVTVTDIDEGKRALATELGAQWVPLDQAATLPTEILVPAALGGLLTADLVPSLQCEAVVGPANNQLASDDVADLLADHKVLWAPDFLVNAGGVICGARMEMANDSREEALVAVTRIGETLRDVFTRAAERGTTPLEAASALAAERLGTAG